MTTDQYLRALDHLVVQLADIDEAVDDNTLMRIVLKGLPTPYKGFVTTFGTMLNNKSNRLSFHDLQQQLQAEEYHLNRADTKERALVTTHRQQQQLNHRPFVQSKNKGSASSSRRPQSSSNQHSRSSADQCNAVICSHSGRKGHPISQCEIKETPEQQLRGLSLEQIKEIQNNISSLRDIRQQAHQAKQTPSDTSGDEQAAAEATSEEVNLVAMMATVDNEWVVDSGSLSHYSKSHDSISDYSSVSPNMHITIAGGG